MKSRFSHRIIQCPPPPTAEVYIELARKLVGTPLSEVDYTAESEATSPDLAEIWSGMWMRSVEV